MAAEQFPQSSDAATPHPDAERRRSERQPFKATAWISAEVGAGASGDSSRVTVVDFSLNGVGFISETAMELEATRWFVLDHGNLRASSRIRIVNCRREENGQFHIGAEFH